MKIQKMKNEDLPKEVVSGSTRHSELLEAIKKLKAGESIEVELEDKRDVNKVVMAAHQCVRRYRERKNLEVQVKQRGLKVYVIRSK